MHADDGARLAGRAHQRVNVRRRRHEHGFAGLIGHQFHGGHHAFATHFAHMGVSHQLLQLVLHVSPRAAGVAGQVFAGHDVQIRVGRSASQRMARIGVAVHQRSGHAGLVPGAGNAFVDERGPQGHITRIDALGHGHDVRGHAPGARTAHGADAAKAGHDLVADEQDAVLVQQLPQTRPVAVVRHDHAACALHRLGHQGGDVVRPDLLDQLGQLVQAQLRKLGRVGFVPRVAVGVGRFGQVAAGQERLVGAAKHRVAVDGGATKMHAVVAPFERNELVTIGLAVQLPVLACQLERGFHRV